jgi:hypothetical protein
MSYPGLFLSTPLHRTGHVSIFFLLTNIRFLNLSLSLSSYFRRFPSMATDLRYTYQRVHGETEELSDDDDGRAAAGAEDKQRRLESLVWFRRPSVRGTGPVLFFIPFYIKIRRYVY